MTKNDLEHLLALANQTIDDLEQRANDGEPGMQQEYDEAVALLDRIQEEHANPGQLDVWYDFGDGIVRHHHEETQELLDAFMEGVNLAMSCNGLDDFLKFETEEEVEEHLKEE